METATLHWLAGLLEGEGTFLSGPPSSPFVPYIRLEMTDRDVVERVAALFKRTIHQSRPDRDRYKTPYATILKGHEAVALMLRIRPLMGLRRQASIDRAVQCSRSFNGTGPGILSHQTAQEIIASRAAGISVLGLATKYGVSKSTIYKVASGVLAIRPPVSVQPAMWSDAHSDDWLAGLLEGEGCFGMRPSGRNTCASLALQMTDRDVVERAAILMGARSVYPQRAANPEWSTTFVARIGGARAAAVMERLQPKMGSRRSARIAEIVDACWTKLPRAGKISADQGKTIVTRFRSGASAKSLGDEYGISKWSVYALHQGRYFKQALT